ncbi:MAG: DUF4097 family beta strand repeat protein [Lachnospiraceae bacterium]|nr:DUF4097 family beta strand repeat protein [Lachnospiraceae bacterium]
MQRSTRIILIAAGLFIGVGLIIGAIAASINKARTGNILGLGSLDMTSAGERKTVEINEDFSDVEILEISNDIQMIPTDDKKARVEYTDHEDIGLIHNVEVRGGTLVVELKDDSKWYDHVGINFHGFGKEYDDKPLNVYLPAGDYGTVEITAVSSDITVDPIKADTLNITVTSGEIKLDECTVGNAKINSISGDMDLSKVTASDIRLNATSGKLNLDGLTASYVKLSTVSGDMSLRDFDSKSTDINTTSGDVSGNLIGEYNISANTTSGDVNVPSSSSTGNPMNINTTSGDIDLR